METTINVPVEKATELAKLEPGLCELATTYEIIRDDCHRDAAMAFVKEVKVVRLKIRGLFDGITKQAHQLHRAIKGQWNDLDKPFEEHEKSVRKSIGEYDDRLRREQEAERRRVAEEARRIEQERQEAQAKADAELREKLETERLEAAAKLEESGKSSMAQAVIEAPVVVESVEIVAPPAPVYVAPPKPKGSRVVWKHRVIDANLVPRAYMVVDEKLLAALATSQKDKACVPGVEFTSTSVTTIR